MKEESPDAREVRRLILEAEANSAAILAAAMHQREDALARALAALAERTGNLLQAVAPDIDGTELWKSTRATLTAAREALATHGKARGK